MIRDPERLLGEEGLGDAVGRLREAARPGRTVVGWGTVDLDRAATELAGEDGAGRAEPAADDELLGAWTRLLRFPGDRELVLLEPSTEGLLAASLARFGEGILALYLVADVGAPERADKAGFTLSAEAGGPFGRQRRVVVGPRWGPHLVLVTTAGRRRPATIGT